ncbi:MAG TPA: hypothetical protein VGF45_24670, partial [Polyangia bacterium]
MGCSSSSNPPAGGTGGTSARGGSSGGNSGGSTGTGGSTSSGSGGSQSSGTGGTSGGSGGSSGSGGSGPAGTGGTTSMGTGGTSGGTGGSSGGDAGRPDATADMSTGGDGAALPRFSFFVTSIDALRRLSGNEKGFGGDLRFGKPDGLSGADEICRQIAESSMPGAGNKPWRAFLSAVQGPNGTPVNAIDRVGEGPWYDRLGRIVAMNKADLVQPRPRGAHPMIINDLPNEKGVPNGFPDGGRRVDNHHMLTGSKTDGTVYSANKNDTCQDWTSKAPNTGRPRCGVAWPRTPGDSWINWGYEGGCAPGYNLIEGAGPTEGNQAVGSNGGYGGWYCLSTIP